MNAKKIIWEEIGEELQKNSFEYAGWKNNAWTYEISKEPKHTLAIVKYRFGENCISYELIGRAGPVVQAPAIDSLSKYNIGMNYYRYDNEEEFRLIVHEFWREVKKRGWEDLDKKYHDIKRMHATLSKWHVELVEKHEKLNKEFIDKYDIEIQDFNNRSLDDYFIIIDQIIDSFSGCEQNVDKYKLIQIAAFLGQLFIDNAGANWELDEDEMGNSSIMVNIFSFDSLAILQTLYAESIGMIERGILHMHMSSIIEK